MKKLAEKAIGDDDAGEREHESLPGADAIVSEEKRLHYANWLDTPLPTLGKKTPRQASRNRQPAGVRFDVGVLRRELGMES